MRGLPFILAALVAMALTPASANATERYRLQPLPSLSGSPEHQFARDINNRNEVVGYARTRLGPIAFLWRPGSGIAELAASAGPSPIAIAAAVSNAGHVAGKRRFTSPLHPNHGFVWTIAGGTHDTGALEGAKGLSDMRSVNSEGVAVGSSDRAGHRQAVRWSTATGLQPLARLPAAASASEARAINDAGEIAGHMVIDGQTRAFVMATSGRLTVFPDDGVSTRASAISSDGRVAGRLDEGSTQMGFVWKPGTTPRRLSPGSAGPGSFAEALDVNGAGTAVGRVLTANGMRAFVAPENGEPVLLDATLLAGGEPPTLYAAEAINDCGVIAAYGRAEGERAVTTYVLTPVDVDTGDCGGAPLAAAP